jgi:macrolide-specific efflux system membrane fusion protein
MRKLFIGIVLVAIVLAGVWYFRKTKEDQTAQVTYSLARVEQGSIEIKVLATGTIEPYTRVEVSSSVSGRIDRVEVDEGDIVKEGDILAWISSEDRIALLDAARSGLESAQESNDQEAIREAQTAYQIADKAYKAVPLTNSISGEVISRSCEPGQNVSTATVLFVIADRLVATVEVDEVDIGKISRGQETQITLDAFPDEQFKGKVTKVSREGTLVSDVVVYDVMVDPLKVPRHWASGMTANVEFLVEKKDSILVIPKGAVTERGNQSFVTVMEDQPVTREIQTGITDGKMIEIIQGLKEGDRIVQAGKGNSSDERDDFRPPMAGMIGRSPR